MLISTPLLLLKWIFFACTSIFVLKRDPSDLSFVLIMEVWLISFQSRRHWYRPKHGRGAHPHGVPSRSNRCPVTCFFFILFFYSPCACYCYIYVFMSFLQTLKSVFVHDALVIVLNIFPKLKGSSVTCAPLLSPTVFSVGWWPVYFLKYFLFEFNTTFHCSTL